MFDYYTVEDRIYRTPAGLGTPMERWSLVEGRWVPYHGDAVKVLLEGSRSPKAPVLPLSR